MSRDLSSLSAPSRGSGLGGLLPALRPAQTAAPASPAEPGVSSTGSLQTTAMHTPDSDGHDQTSETESVPSDTPKQTRRKPVSNRPSTEARADRVDDKSKTVEGETGLRTATVYLPAVLLEQVKDAKEVAGTTFTAWILDQLDVHWNELDDIFDKPAPRTSPLPARGVARRRREVDTPQLLHLRVTQAELDVIEARSREVGAGNRSAFITEVARLGVQKSPDARPSRRRAGVR